jgi:hypothetical protein
VWEAAETALIQDHEETARINNEIAQHAVAQDNEVAAEKAAEYEKIPEIQLLRAPEAEDRREWRKRPPSSIPPRPAPTFGRRRRSANSSSSLS